MSEIIELPVHFSVTLIKLPKPGDVKVVMAESIAMACTNYQLLCKLSNRTEQDFIAQ